MFEDLVKSIKQGRRERGSKLKGGLKRKPAEEEPSADDEEQEDDAESEKSPDEVPPEEQDAEEADAAEPEETPDEPTDDAEAEEPAKDAEAEDEKDTPARSAIKDILSKPPIDASQPDDAEQGTDQAAQPASPAAPQPGGQPQQPQQPEPEDIPPVPSVQRAEVLDRNYGLPERKDDGELTKPKSEDGLMPNAGAFANSEKAKRLWAERMKRLEKLKRETGHSLDIEMGTSRRGARWPLRRGPLGSYPSIPPS